MVHSRFMTVVLAIALGSGLAACSQGEVSKPAPAAGEGRAQAAAHGAERTKLQTQWWHNESITGELDLTEEQLQTINDLMTVSSGEANQQRSTERQLSIRYLRVLAQEPYDPVMADRISDRLVEVQATARRLRVETIRDLRDTLTQEQWTKLWELAPRAIQIGQFQVKRGPKIAVTDEDPAATPTPAP